MRVGSKLMGFKEFLASPDFARIRESKSPLTVRGPTGRGPGPSSKNIDPSLTPPCQ